MTELEKLNERISQLTELVKTGSEAIESMETALKVVEEERDRLADQRREQEPKFERVRKGEKYYCIRNVDRRFEVIDDKEENHWLDEASYNGNNYFHTRERAQEVMNKINFLLKLERLHDTFCPNYKPNWNDGDELKYSVYYNNGNKCYEVNSLAFSERKTNVFFATFAIAQKVCDILNAELEEKK